jgi:hypothetical protein
LAELAVRSGGELDWLKEDALLYFEGAMSNEQLFAEETVRVAACFGRPLGVRYLLESPQIQSLSDGESLVRELLLVEGELKREN